MATARSIFWVWLGIGLQSFGGGAATLYLIRREAIEQHKWLTAEEFTRYWGICQIAPGINIIGVTILIGWRAGGIPGLIAALAGLLVPSATITIILSASYAAIRGLPVVQAAVHGVIPATCGLGLLLAWQMARPPLQESQKEGHSSLVISIAVVLMSAMLVGIVHVPVIAVLWGAGTALALVALLRTRRQTAGGGQNG